MRVRAKRPAYPVPARRRRLLRIALLLAFNLVIPPYVRPAQGAVTSRYFLRTRPETTNPLALEMHKRAAPPDTVFLTRNLSHGADSSRTEAPIQLRAHVMIALEPHTAVSFTTLCNDGIASFASGRDIATFFGRTARRW